MVDPITVVYALWAVWVLVWIVAGLKSAPTATRQPGQARLAGSALLAVGAILTFMHPDRFGVLLRPILPNVSGLEWLGAALTALGLGISIWARAHLGRLWSGVVEIKKNHTIVRTGPYGVARHPIYSGLLLAFIGTAVARGTIGALIGLTLLVLGIVLRIRQEERLLVAHFGDAYRRYQGDVPALIPGFRAH